MTAYPNIRWLKNKWLYALSFVTVISAVMWWKYSEGASRARVRSAIRQELVWVDSGMISGIYEIPEWSTIFGPAFLVGLEADTLFSSDVYCLSSRTSPRRLLVFYDYERFSSESGESPSMEEAEAALRIKVEEFNRFIEPGIPLDRFNKYIYAHILSNCLFDGGMTFEQAYLMLDFVEPRIRFDSEDGGYIYTLFHSYDERRKHLRYWIVDTKDGGFIQTWTISDVPYDPGKPSNQPPELPASLGQRDSSVTLGNAHALKTR